MDGQEGKTASPTGSTSMSVNDIAAVQIMLRANADGWRQNAAALVCSFVAVAIAGVAGWLGGELVERLAVGVDEGAHINAPSSLSHRPVSSSSSAPLPTGG